MSRAIAFDFDGTLVDSAPGILSGLRLALEKNRIDPAVPLDAGLIGPPLRATLARLAGSDDGALLDTLAADFKRCYDGGGYRDTRVYPGIGEALAALRQRAYTLYLATNKRGAPTRLILDHLGWTPLFAGIYCLDEHPGCENKAQMLGEILARHALPAADTPYVGDTEGDAQAARHHGMPYIHAAWGYGEPAAARSICAQPAELLAALDRPAWI